MDASVPVATVETAEMDARGERRRAAGILISFHRRRDDLREMI